MATTTIKNYLSLVKFSHTIFAMPFALIGFFLGLYFSSSGFSDDSYKKLLVSGIYPPFGIGIALFLVIICMVSARSAAMAFNRYLDSHFDAKNPRTAIREIPAGIISKESALRFVI